VVSGALLSAVLLAGKPDPALAMKLLALLTLILGFLVGGLFVIRHFFKKMKSEMSEATDFQTKARPDDQSVFMMAAIQQAVEKSRDQEKELDKLRRLGRQRGDDSQQLAAVIMKNLDTGVLLLNSRGLITEDNPAAKTSLGHQLLSGRYYREVLWPGYQPGEEAPDGMVALEECLRSGKPVPPLEVRYRTPSGAGRLLQVGLSPLLSAEGAPSGAVCVLTDFTGLAALQEQAASQGVVAAGIIHDVRNILTTISGYAQLIGQAEPEEGRRYAAKIVKESLLLAEVLRDFASLSRSQPLSLSPVALREVVESCFSEVLEQSGLAGMTLDLEGDFQIVQADGVLLREAVTHLLRYGCEAMAGRGGGRTRVRSELEASTVHLRFQSAGETLTPESLEKIFYPALDSQRGWTGLSLAVARKIILQHNGTITAESVPEQGTTFLVTLPAA
jgi:nitrogen-specific signal transduction histidine kinase